MSIVEAALLRPWPGNIRELLSATVAAAAQAREQGGALKASDLGAEAGLLDEREPPAAPTPIAMHPRRERPRRDPPRIATER